MSDDKGEDIAPPFHGFIATTYDALLVFEAARRGMIPRVTRRLNDSERNLVQSGSVFVYDEHESGIKRWTDGHSWSPSRILANFLVYRETIKPSEGGKDGRDEMKRDPMPIAPAGSRPGSSHRHDGRPSTGSSGSGSPAVTEARYAESSRMALEAAQRPLVHGQMRPRSAAEAGGCLLENGVVIDRHLERKLVGSLTNSYLFQPGGLVKKTMTLTVAGFHQHVVSYYTLEDAVAGRLRRPSTIPEFAALEISPDYLNLGSFRYPPSIEIGQDGVPRYHGEPDDRPVSPMARGSVPYNADVYESYGPPGVPLDNPHHQPRLRSVAVPPSSMGGGFGASPAPMPPYNAPPGSSQGYYDPQSMHLAPMPRQSGPSRPSSSSRRYDPYASPNPRMSHTAPTPMVESGHTRRQSVPPPSSSDSGGYYLASEYNYQPPSTAPGSFSYYSSTAATQPPPPLSQQPPMASPIVSPSYGSGPQYQPWHQPSGPAPALRLLSTVGREDNPPSSSGSMDSQQGSAHHVVQGGDSWGAPVMSNPHPHPPHGGNHSQPVWDNHSHPPPLPPMPQYGSVQQDNGWQASFA
ncbi:Global transcription regulator sge1 [Vanrija albida]|uniref:Global transcription regulator sge1 n=1 Tax=Vanrija albida TaxID=181172 RepID=A0ABR3Q4F9_9TREE